MNIWISTDWHLFTKDIDARHPFRSRHNLGLLSDTFATEISQEDLYIFLGDLCDPVAADQAKVRSIIQTIPCRKLMCRGNHDVQDDLWYKEVGFDEVSDIIRYHNIIFSHKPVRVAPDEINIHGHLHTEKMSGLGPNHINAFAVNWNDNDKPVLLEDLLDSAIVQQVKIAQGESRHIQEKFEQYTSLDNDHYSKFLDITDEVDNAEDVISESADIERGLFHLSIINLNNKTLQPKIPNNFLTKNGYEDNKTKRVCLSKTIDGALIAMSQNLSGMDLYVHKPAREIKIITPTEAEVPDCNLTGEVWCTRPVKLICVGKIHIDGPSGSAGIYRYGKNTAELYSWYWDWIDNDANVTFTNNLTGIVNFCDWMDKHFQYGLVINGKWDPSRNTTDADWDKYLKVQSPAEIEQTKVGVCWDYVSYEAWYFKQNFPDIPFKTYYLQFFPKNNSGDCPSHTILTFTIGTKHYYFENSFRKFAGVYEANSEEDIINYVLKLMSDHPDPSIPKGDLLENWGYDAWMYNALDGRLFGMGCQDYMTYVMKHGKCMNHTYRTPRSVRPVNRHTLKENTDILDEILFKDVDEPRYMYEDDNAFQRKVDKSKEQQEDTEISIEESVMVMDDSWFNESVKFTKISRDIKEINDSLDPKEQMYIGSDDPKDDVTIYQDVMYANRKPVAFVEVYQFPNEFNTGYICVAVRKEFRGKGYAKSMLVKTIAKFSTEFPNITHLGWLVDNDNVASIKTAKSLGFTLDHVEGEESTYKYKLTKSLTESADIIFPDIVMDESWVIIEDDLKINFDDWKPGNPLWVAGSSGDGKSTLTAKLADEYNATIVTTDALLMRMSMPHEEFLKKINTSDDFTNVHKMSFVDNPVVDYIKAHPNLPSNAKDMNTRSLKSEITNPEMIKLYTWLLHELGNNPKYKNRLYVVEGCDVCLMDPKVMSTKPLIILGGSRMRSFMRRVKRDMEEKGDVNPTRAIFKYLKKYNIQNRKLDDQKDNFRKGVISVIDKSVRLQPIVSKVYNAYSSKISGGKAGNQNCLLCTWATEVNIRGEDMVPRPVYSPRDPIFSINGYDIVRNPVKVQFSSAHDVQRIVTKSGPGSRYYIHVNWKGSTGGHEFIILNEHGKVLVIDSQNNMIADINSRQAKRYLTDINYKNSYMVRMDDRELNRDILRYNDSKYIIPWDDIEDPKLLEEASLGTKTLYHGSPFKLTTLEPVALDFGNAFQEAGWSIFFFNRYDLAEKWAIFITFRRLRKDDPNGPKGHVRLIKVAANESRLFINEEDLNEYLEYLSKHKVECYVYTCQLPIMELGIGNDTTHDEYTIRRSVTPDKCTKVIVTPQLFKRVVTVKSDEEVERLIKANKQNMRGPISIFITRDYYWNKVNNEEDTDKIGHAAYHGNLGPGSDIEQYMKQNGINLNVPLSERLKPFKPFYHESVNDVVSIPDNDKNLLDQHIQLGYRLIGREKSNDGFNLVMKLEETATSLPALTASQYREADFDCPPDLKRWVRTVTLKNDKGITIGTAKLYEFEEENPSKSYLYTLDINPHYNEDYRKAAIDILIREFKLREMNLGSNESDAINLYKSFGFKQIASKEGHHENILTMRLNESTLQENFIGTVPDIEWNRDEWKPNGKNFLWICGLSGGGKTTLANKIGKDVGAEVIHLDDLAEGAFVGSMSNPNFTDRMSPTMQEYWNSTTDHIKMYKWGDQRLALETDKFVKWMIKKHESDGKLYIIEGCEIWYMDPDYLIHQPLIIKGTSAIRTTFWRFKRTYGQHRAKGENALKTFEHCVVQFMRIYKNGAMIAAENTLMRFKDILEAARKYNGIADEVKNESATLLGEASTIDHTLSKDEKTKLSKKYGLTDVGNHTEYDDEKELAEMKRKAAAEKKEKELKNKKKKRDRQLKKARSAKKRKAFVNKVKSHLPGVSQEDASAVDNSELEWFTEPSDTQQRGDGLYSGEKRFFKSHTDGEKFIQETYQFQLLDKIQFFDRIDEAGKGSNKKLLPVYVIIMHTGTMFANAIKTAVGSVYSHASISFDSSLRNMYSFARKLSDDGKASHDGGFRMEDIQNKFFKDREVKFSMYMVPCTEEQIGLMKKRLNYFKENQSKFTYDFTGLVKNFFGISDNPEYKWFCTRFVADILNAGRPKDPYIKDPFLVRPDDFMKTNFAMFVTSGYLDKYNQKEVDSTTKRLLNTKKVQQFVEESENECALDLPRGNPYERHILNYQLSQMDESTVDDFIVYLQSFKVRFDGNGDILITRREFDQLESHYRTSLRLIKSYQKTGNVEGVKEELYKIHYMTELISKYYLKPYAKNFRPSTKDIRKDMLDLRAIMLNTFKQSLEWVCVREPGFNFQRNYQASTYGSDTKIPQKIITHVGTAIMTALK